MLSRLWHSNQVPRIYRLGILALLVVALLTVVAVRHWPRVPPEPVRLTGHAMGTTWSVKVRDEVASPPVLEKVIDREFEWAESLTSHWRTNTALARFNQTATTNAIKMPWPVTTLSRWSSDIHRESMGAFDITVGPLVRLWGFGPGGVTGNPPTAPEVERVASQVGMEKLAILRGALKKEHPLLEVDLSGIAKGWAINKVVDELVFQGYTNFLVEAGGELRAVGRWNIAVDYPPRHVTLWNESIATSGSYRQNYRQGGLRVTHLIDPRIGYPIRHRTVAVSVRHADCARADAWATALNVLGAEEGMPVAERLELAAQFVVENERGGLVVVSSPAWKQRDLEVRRGQLTK